jgi:hypothetical protein
MMIKRNTLFVLSLLFSGFFVSCLDSFEERAYYSANVTSFGFDEHDTCEYIEDYVFNIDQYNGVAADSTTGTIYNLDSLPFGSVVNSLYPTMTLQSTNGNIYMNDTIWEDEDSIDFTTPVVFKNTSSDGLYTKSYTIYVNVHQVNPDSMMMFTASTALPAASSSNKIISLDNGTLQCFAPASGGGLTAWQTSDTCKTWTSMTVTGLTGNMNILSLCRYNSKYYIASKTHQVYASGDGESWSPIAAATTSDGSSITILTLYGEITKKYVYDDGDSISLIGLVVDASGDTCFAKSADGLIWTTGSKINADFPLTDYGLVKGTTATNVQYYTIVSGLNASGDFSSSTWSTEDGLTWVLINDGTSYYYAPPKRKGAALFFYDAYLVSFGGIDENGKYHKDMRISPDKGVSWEDAPDSWVPEKLVLATMGTGLAYTGAHVVHVPDTVNDEDREFIWLIGGLTSSGATSTVWNAFLYEMIFKRR